MNKTKTKPKTFKYKIVLDVLGKEWTARGDAILEALKNLTPTYDQIKGKGMIYIYVGGKKKLEKLMFMHIIRRILSNKIIKAKWAKNFELLLK